MYPSFQALLQAVRERVQEVEATALAAELRGGRPPRVLDVREAEETGAGGLPGALHLPRGLLELRVEALVPARDTELVVYCAGGTRSALAADTLALLGYGRVRSLRGGVRAWQEAGETLETLGALAPEQRERYSRHLLLPEVGEEGQRRLLDARVLLVGAGALGSTAALYLAAAGVGTLGVLDDGLVDTATTTGQLLHTPDRAGLSRALSAQQTLARYNPDVRVLPHLRRLRGPELEALLASYELVVDASDEVATHDALGVACARRALPMVYGQTAGHEGQVTAFVPGEGPCYRCLYPAPPPDASRTDGVTRQPATGALPGFLGSLLAVEALKLLLGRGTSLAGRLMLYDGRGPRVRELRLRQAPDCSLCGGSARTAPHLPAPATGAPALPGVGL